MIRRARDKRMYRLLVTIVCVSRFSQVAAANGDGSSTAVIPDSDVPANHTGRVLTQATLRADVVSEGGTAEAVLANATARSGDYFTVPKFGGKR